MISPSKYNGINFSENFTRESESFNFDNQRKKNVISKAGFEFLSFYSDSVLEPAIVKLFLINSYALVTIIPSNKIVLSVGFIYFFSVAPENLLYIDDVCLCVQIDNEKIYSEIYSVKSASYLTENEICELTAYNADFRHGYLDVTYPAFGFFRFSKLNSDIFINDKVEYKYSYGRKKILSSENNIGKRFTFLDLTMYQQNLLKWLCNTENLFIDGVQYQLISDFTELLADENSELKDLRADFIEVEQSFFGKASTKYPNNIFPDKFFMQNSSSIGSTEKLNNQFEYTLPFNLE